MTETMDDDRRFKLRIEEEAVKSRSRKSIPGYWTLGLVLLLSLSVHPLSLGQENLPATIKKVEPSIVSIIIVDKGGNAAGQGSGFFINQEGEVITSRHVLEGASRAFVVTSTEKRYPIQKVVAEDPEGDLIRVSIDLEGEKVQPLPISSTYPETGERVVVIGTPLGLEKTVSDGIVSAVREVPGFGKIVQITAPISPGSSGSPVVNMKGEVIGIATFFIVAGQNLNFAIPGERITRLITGKGESLPERGERRAKELRSFADEFYATGVRFLWAGDYEKALPHFVEVIKRNPTHAEAYFQIGYCLAKLGRYLQAIEPYQQALRIKPKDAETHNNLCVAFGRVGRYPEAIVSCEEALRIEPNLAEPYSNMAWVHYKMGRYPEAIEACKQAIRLKPDLAQAHFDLGSSYAALKEYKKAMESYKEAIRIKLDFAAAHMGLGAAYNEMGRYEEAIASYRESIRLKPEIAESHLNLGMAYLKTGDRGSALNEYRILKGLNQEMANRLFNLIYE